MAPGGAFFASPDTTAPRHSSRHQQYFRAMSRLSFATLSMASVKS